MAKKVKIYSTPYCTYCKLAKNFFIKNNVTFTEVDVSEDEKELNSMVKKSGQMGVPVLDMDGEIIVGFDRPAIDAALKKEG